MREKIKLERMKVNNKKIRNLSFTDCDHSGSDEDCSEYAKKSSVDSFESATDEETEISNLKPAEDKQDISIPYWKLYSYASIPDWLCILTGIIFSVICGLCIPYFCIVYSMGIGDYVIYSTAVSNGSLTSIEKRDAGKLMTSNVYTVILQCAGIGVIAILGQYIAGVMFCYSSLRQTYKIRQKYFERFLIQDISWHDLNRTGDFATTFSESLAKIEDGIGEKVSHFLYYESVFLSGIISALCLAWKLTLICCISLPVAVVLMTAVSWVSTKFASKDAELTSIAGAIAEEVFSAIKTVKAFEGQKKELNRFSEPLIKAKNNNIKRSFLDGIGNGSLWFFVYAGCAVSFYFGIKLIIDDRSLPEEDRQYDAMTVVAVFCNTFVGFWTFSAAAPYFQVFGVACGAAGRVFKVLESEPKIHVSLKRGMKLKNIKGEITFKDVNFRYPSRLDVKILNGVDLRIEAGECVAFVGSSGSGKSTCIQLLQRFYDPISGEICIDNKSIKDFNLSWFRSKIGIVGQEPVLFATTISENIRYGKLSATQEDIEKAAKKAQVHKFIKSLPDGYDTVLGEQGTQLSGGQKQKIAIARALIRNPSILLLDEATSALDTTSEAEVQAALDSVTDECTTIIVAHRLSTVKNADRIFVFSEGKVVEEGSFQTLINAGGVFYNLVKSQGMSHQQAESRIEEHVTDEKNKHMAYEKYCRRESYIDSNKFRHRHSVFDQDKGFTEVFMKVLRTNKPEWFWIFVGCIASTLIGCVLPAYSVLYGDIIGILEIQDNVLMRKYADMICLYFLLLGIVAGLLYIIQMYSFGMAGENLTLRVRTELFSAILKQETGWFDRKENSVGALCAKLSGDSADIQSASGVPIGTVFVSLSTLGISNGLALYYHWKLALILIAFVPLMLISVYFEPKVLEGDSDLRDEKLRKSAGIAVEAISNIRTVASLGCDKFILTLFEEELMPYINIAKRRSHFKSFVLGIARSMIYFSYTAGLVYGCQLIEEGVHYGRVTKVMELVVYGSMALGTAFAFTPNFEKGVQAAKRIFSLLERTPEIRNVKHASKRNWETGDIEYSRVYFSYPTRPDIPILRGLDLNIQAGRTIALVGSSGCGKSTLIQTLERFYDVTAGEVCVDDADIKVMDLQHLRAQFAMVSQEPNLFDRTVADNIAYGNNNKPVSMAQIIQAAKNANIHEFISSLPLGYETRLGSKGAQISGGQKQRIAIARALIRNPRVLLLDEATSALDNESEKVVQEALDKAKENRTCIMIAHRLTTIKDADLICVIHKGKVVESGTHQELIEKAGHYYEFYKQQSGMPN